VKLVRSWLAVVAFSLSLATTENCRLSKEYFPFVFTFSDMANRWASLAVATEDPKPQRPSKKHPAAAASADASNGSGVPPASINLAAAAAFPAPSHHAPTVADFPALPGASPAAAYIRPQSARTTAASQVSAAPISQPKLAPSDANWGYLSSERQKDKVRCFGATLLSRAHFFMFRCAVPVHL
jgi:hypothetical protein